FPLVAPDSLSAGSPRSMTEVSRRTASDRLLFDRRENITRHDVDRLQPVDTLENAFGTIIFDERCGLFIIGIKPHFQCLMVVVGPTRLTFFFCFPRPGLDAIK